MTNNFPDIICDTNIWYLIGGGFIKEEEIKDKKLAIHWLSVGELCFTNKKFTNRELLKNILISTIQNMRRLYHYPPTNHIAYLIDKNNIYETNMQMALFALIIQLNSAPTAPELDVNFEAREKYFKGLKDIVKTTNSNSLQLKEKIVSKSTYRKMDITLSIREYISESVNLASEKQIIDIDTFDWSILELYEGALIAFTKMLTIGETKMTENDLVDIIQLMYVQPGHLFWTTDKKLKTIIKAANLDHYLYEK